MDWKLMNSTIASNINAARSAEKDSVTQKIANTSRASLLVKNIDFSQTDLKKPSFAPSGPGQFLCKVGGNNEVLLNGQKKLKNGVDQNKNTFNNSYNAINGNKEKAEDGIPTPKVQLYTGKISVEWKQVYKIGAGLHNLGNTCFMNTVIQCLTYCPPLANYLLVDNSDHSSKCSISTFCMMCTLQKHMKRTIGKNGDVIKPHDVYQRLKLISKNFQFGRQEDAHEFLRYVIDHLVKSCLSQNNNFSKLDAASKETTVINQIFGGYQRSQVTCLKCKEKSNTFDYFMDFILDIKQNVISLEKALEKYVKPELLDQENAYKCPKCKMKVTAHKKFTVFKPPNVATFQFKRFDYNRSFGGKITKAIAYPEKLNLRPYLSESEGDPVMYRLNAVLVHSGGSCNSGHYFCYVRNSNGFWYLMDDERVQQVSLPTVLSQSAYVLFYVKAEASQPLHCKKYSENRNTNLKEYSCFKEISYPIKKNFEVSVKPSPLTERSQVKLSSPTLKHQLSSPLNNKKLPMSPNQSRDRTPAVLQPSMPTIQDIQPKPTHTDVAPPKKAKHSSDTSNKANSDHSGLVPYNKDSSESSDDNDSVCNGNANGAKAYPDGLKVNGAKVSLKFNRSLNGSLEAKRKSSSSKLNSSPSPAVIATSAWTVTEADPASPSAASSSSCNSVHSTTNWHVTSAKPAPEAASIHKAPESNGQANGTPARPRVEETARNGVQETKTGVTSLPGERNGAPPSPPSGGKKCDFRKQSSPQNEQSFLGCEKKPDRPGSFLKRKRGESDSEDSEVHAQLHDDEGRPHSVPKKAKHSSKELPEPPPVNGVAHSSERLSLGGPSSKSHDNAKAGLESPSGKTKHKLERSKEKKRRSASSSPDGCNSGVEYEWVEKTKDTIENNQHSSSRDKHSEGYHSGSSSHSKTDRKHDVVSELNKRSSYFYGSDVPTWNGKHHYYDDSSKSFSARRKSLDDYEDEYDRGKTRKFKNKDRYSQYHYYKKNPFQKQSEKNYSYSKYNGNSHYGHHNHHHKSYDSHYKWKQNRNHDHQHHRKYFKSHFQR